MLEKVKKKMIGGRCRLKWLLLMKLVPRGLRKIQYLHAKATALYRWTSSFLSSAPQTFMCL